LNPDSPVVVGGGISGLAAAYYLRNAGIPSTIIEPAPPGGLLGTEEFAGFRIERGPDSMLTAKPAGIELVRELGLGADLIPCNDALRGTYILRDGTFHRLPEGMLLCIPSKAAAIESCTLLSGPGKRAILAERERTEIIPPPEELSIASFIEDRFGAEALHYLAQPLLAGVYGGDAALLDAHALLGRFTQLAGAHPSLMRTLEQEQSHHTGPAFYSLRRGMGQLAQALMADANVVRSAVVAVEREVGGYRVRLESGETLTGPAVFIAVPAWRAAEMLWSMPEVAKPLSNIPYTSSTIVALAFRREDVPHALDAFGFLVPRAEQRRLLACTWVGSKFADRVPPEHALLRCFFREAGAPPHEYVAAARSELRQLMGITTEPLFHRVFSWPRSMPQYELGHRDRVAQLRSALVQHQGLFVIGNAYEGVGVPDSIRLAKNAADTYARSIAVRQ
jgi:protoporphyrinogen/coproporphyrinogen III oxidase